MRSALEYIKNILFLPLQNRLVISDIKYWKLLSKQNVSTSYLICHQWIYQKTLVSDDLSFFSVGYLHQID